MWMGLSAILRHLQLSPPRASKIVPFFQLCQVIGYTTCSHRALMQSLPESRACLSTSARAWTLWQAILLIFCPNQKIGTTSSPSLLFQAISTTSQAPWCCTSSKSLGLSRSQSQMSGFRDQQFPLHFISKLIRKGRAKTSLLRISIM